MILVHGTIGDRKNLLERLSRTIKAAGFCVFSLDYGNRGLDDIVDSARELKRYTQRVLRATGAEKVSMVGHSQGGMMPRYYIKFLGGDRGRRRPGRHRRRPTTARPSPRRATRSATWSPARRLRVPGVRAAGRRLAVPHPAQRGRRDPGRVSYTQVTTRYDEVVVPHTSGYLGRGSAHHQPHRAGPVPAGRARAPDDPAGHAHDRHRPRRPRPPGPASPEVRPRCW